MQCRHRGAGGEISRDKITSNNRSARGCAVTLAGGRFGRVFGITERSARCRAFGFGFGNIGVIDDGLGRVGLGCGGKILRQAVDHGLFNIGGGNHIFAPLCAASVMCLVKAAMT